MRSLTAKEENRIRLAIQDRIMFFSPTISPAPKNVEWREIESIHNALLYYAGRGVKNCIIQPKYMGSYCDIYLHRDIEKTRFFSRKGYPINPRQIDRSDLIQAVAPIHQRMSDLWDDGAELILIQSELLPWSALGQGLIIKDFKSYEVCHQSHADYLANSNLRSAVANQMNSDDFKNYLKDVAVLGKKQIAEKYPQHVIRQYEGMRFLTFPHQKSYQEAINLYRKQLEIYGKEGELEFKPFNILKTVYADGREVINEDNWYGFTKTTGFEEPYHLVGLENLSDNPEFPGAYNFFKTLVQNRMEGVIIKPIQIWDPEMVPMFKVRNNDYLQMIYGVDFQDNYDYNLDRRKTGKKMKCSINEWNIAQSLLRIPVSQINPDNSDYTDLVIKRILEEDFESQLDIRL